MRSLCKAPVVRYNIRTFNSFLGCDALGQKYKTWNGTSSERPKNLADIERILAKNRQFQTIEKLDYGDHGLDQVIETVVQAIEQERRIALYADYDVDGTMSCVSWIWFFQEIGFENFVHYIPCRFKEGYGLNLKAMEHLIDTEKAEVIITMDTGITANQEAAFCRSRGVTFICTDHHKIQSDKIPDAIILNPKLHPDPIYQELCGCGITFVLLRKLGQVFPINSALWTDLLALAGMATICDVVPLNGVNHRLAKMGVDALHRSQRPVLKRLREACSLSLGVSETDVGFRLGPRINAVGRLEHADSVIRAFVQSEPEDLIKHMDECNERRKSIQRKIVEEAEILAAQLPNEPILFLGGDWHPGVVGIAASKIAEKFWRPTWLFHRGESICRGSARSIAGFDVTDAMGAVDGLFTKFGGHRAAGGFSFPIEAEAEIRERLIAHSHALRQNTPLLWESKAAFDCELPVEMLTMDLAVRLNGMRPFGHGFEEPRFAVHCKVASVDYYRDKLTGEPKHSIVTIQGAIGQPKMKIKYFNEVLTALRPQQEIKVLLSAEIETWQGSRKLGLLGRDIET